MLLLFMLVLYGLFLGGIVAYLKILLAHRSTWPASEAFAATIMTVAAFAFSRFVRSDPFSWVFEPMILMVQLPPMFFAAVLWIYVIGRLIRCL